MSFLIDSDIGSAYLKNDPRVRAQVTIHFGRLHVSAVTVGELMVWVLRAKAPPKRLRSVEKFLVGCQVLDVDRQVAETFGRIRAGLLDIGQPVREIDLLNAAVVTHNVADYRDVPGLSIVDWMIP